ncbi:MAG: AAA family ATPase, partial [Clostridia bacterium]|nr:AAA family ATPase [Clostridia bacterium]
MVCSRCKQRPATVFITRMEGDKTINDGLCLVCAKELGIKPVCDIINQFGMSDEDLEAVDEQISGMIQSVEEGDEEGFKPGGAATFPFLQNLFPNMGGGEKKGEAKDTPPEKEKDKGQKRSRRQTALEQYCTDLTARARDGLVGRIIGRDRELYRVTQILCRRTKNNPCLIGEPGVGKTAIAEGLALRIAAGTVPARLQDKEIHHLDLTALVAGTQFRGQFESRIKALVDEVKAKGNVILFIDEIHNLVGTGDAEGSMS